MKIITYFLFSPKGFDSKLTERDILNLYYLLTDIQRRTVYNVCVTYRLANKHVSPLDICDCVKLMEKHL